MIGSGSSSGNRNSRGVSRGLGYPMLSLFDEMNRFFEEALPVAQSTRGTCAFRPRIDVSELEEKYVVQGEFPGLEVSDISLELKDNTLTLSGEKRLDSERKDGERVYVERTFGAFSRTIPFSLEVDEDNATAEMKNGVLTVTVPKSSRAIRGAKKLSIKTA